MNAQNCKPIRFSITKVAIKLHLIQRNLKCHTSFTFHGGKNLVFIQDKEKRARATVIKNEMENKGWKTSESNSLNLH